MSILARCSSVESFRYVRWVLASYSSSVPILRCLYSTRRHLPVVFLINFAGRLRLRDRFFSVRVPFQSDPWTLGRTDSSHCSLRYSYPYAHFWDISFSSSCFLLQNALLPLWRTGRLSHKYQLRSTIEFRLSTMQNVSVDTMLLVSYQVATSKPTVRLSITIYSLMPLHGCLES